MILKFPKNFYSLDGEKWQERANKKEKSYFSKNEEKCKKKALELYNFLGVKYYFGEKKLYKNIYGYSPAKGILITNNLTSLDILHELCHWILSSETRKKYSDFGLGEGFNSRHGNKCIVSSEYAQQEEVMVCGLAYIFSYHIAKNKTLARDKIINDAIWCNFEPFNNDEQLIDITTKLVNDWKGRLSKNNIHIQLV